MKISREELEQMTNEYLKTKSIRKIGRKKKKGTLERKEGSINIYLYGEVIKVM